MLKTSSTKPLIPLLILFGLIAISSRPANAQRSLYIPVLSADSGDSMLTLTNPSLDPATVTLTARSYEGAVLEGAGIINPVSITLPASSSRALKAKEVFGQGLTSGWAELQTASPSVSGAFFLLDSNQTALDGGKLQTSSAGWLIFPKATTDLAASNRLVLLNTGNGSTDSVKVSAYENSGQLIAERNISLPAFSGFSGSIADLIPDLLTFDGYAVVEANSGSSQGALIGFETYRDGSDIAVLRAIPDTGRLQTGYLPQFGNQAGTTSTLVVINPEGVLQTVAATVAIMDVSGGNTTLTTVQQTLGPNERLETQLDQLFGFSSATSIVGYVRFETLESPGVLGYLQSQTAGGGLTAVSAQESGYSDALFSHIANGPGSYTGLTLMNAGAQSSSITIDAFDSQASATDTATLTLAPNTGWSGLLSALLPGTDGQTGGRVHIRASAPILTTQIWGSTSTAALAEMPAQRSVFAVQPSGMPLRGNFDAPPPAPLQPPPAPFQPPPAMNQPPVVSAGANQTITLPAYANLAGTATDDGLPTGSLTVQWSVSSGPGTVTFGDASALTTIATFSAAGNYTLQLTVSDGQLSSSSTTTITVNDCGTTVSGRATLTANVTSSVGIAGVQFQLDGTNLGPQLTTSPYSVTWDTTAIANGCHVISAAAQDVNGLTGGTTVNVYVNNP